MAVLVADGFCRKETVIERLNHLDKNLANYLNTKKLQVDFEEHLAEQLGTKPRSIVFFDY